MTKTLVPQKQLGDLSVPPLNKNGNCLQKEPRCSDILLVYHEHQNCPIKAVLQLTGLVRKLLTLDQQMALASIQSEWPSWMLKLGGVGRDPDIFSTKCSALIPAQWYDSDINVSSGTTPLNVSTVVARWGLGIGWSCNVTFFHSFQAYNKFAEEQSGSICRHTVYIPAYQWLWYRLSNLNFSGIRKKSKKTGMQGHTEYNYCTVPLNNFTIMISL